MLAGPCAGAHRQHGRSRYAPPRVCADRVAPRWQPYLRPN